MIRDVFNEAVATWGTESQIGMVYEELGELQTVINRWRRGRATVHNVTEEVADVLIMIEQLKVLLGPESNELVARWYGIKHARLERRLTGRN